MAVIRTPEARFAHLAGFPFQPHYLELGGLRLHYLDEGQGEVIICLHGEPSWSYLYRKLITPLARSYRVIAPDFIGFGRSDKLTGIGEYSFQLHRDTLAGFIVALGLEQITLVAQDWGGLIGLRLAAELPERFARLVIMNTGLPTGEQPMSEAFTNWREFARRTPDLPIGQVIRSGLAHPEEVAREVIAAYEAPFPDGSYKAGAAAWPTLVPIHPHDPGAEAMRRTRQALSRWQKPALVLFSDGDPITRGGDRFFRQLIPTVKDEPELVIQDAGHFLQEEQGEEIARQIAAFIARRPIR